MTRKEHIIFFSILSCVAIIVLGLLYIDNLIGSNSGDNALAEHVPRSLDDETHEGKKSMIETIGSYASIVGLPLAFIGVVLAIPSVRWRVKRYRIEKLKERMQVLFSEGWNHQRIHTPELEKKFFKKLGPKFQKKQYRKLHGIAYEELGREGKNDAWIHKNLKRQAIEEKTKENLKSIMPGPGGIRHR